MAHEMIGMGLSLEVIYSFIIILTSLIIYFSTRELYELTKHQGIKYFRTAFLLFAVAFFFRSFIKIFLISIGITRGCSFALRFIMHTGTLFLFTYFSSIAIFYLLYSVKHKEWKSHKKTILLFHIVAVVIALISVICTNFYVLIGINLFLLLVILLAIVTSNKQKKKNSLHAIYTLLFIFWIINIIDILIPNFLQLFQLIIYLSSVTVFIIILYKVLRNIGVN